MSDDRVLGEEIEALLANPALWDAPGPQVADAIDEALVRPSGASPLRWIVGAAAAVAIVVAAIVVTRPGEPDWTVALAAPEDSAVVGNVSGFDEPTGTRVVLDIQNLDPAEPGTFYEVWWVDLESGGSVSSGGFLESDTIEMWMGIRRGEFPKMLVTLEQADGDPTPSDALIAWSDD